MASHIIAAIFLYCAHFVYGQTVVNIGGIFDPRFPSEKQAFLQAIADINDGTVSNAALFSGLTLNASYMIDSKTPTITETANLLSTDVSIVIGPRYSKSAETISPLFELTKTPFISFRATGSDLTNTNTFPYFFRSVPDVTDVAIPILNVFQHFGWEQAVLLHSSGVWGRGLNFLAQIGVEIGISLKALEIPESFTSAQIAAELVQLSEYEVFIVHVPTEQRATIYEAGNMADLVGPGIAWIGTEDVAVSVGNESSTTQQLMEGSIAIRPVIPTSTKATNLQTSITNSADSFDWYAYFVYDAVLMAAYSLVYVVEELGLDVTSRSSLSANDYFGNIQSYLTYGEILSDTLLQTQLADDWTMTGSIYLRENTRRMSYQLVNLQSAEWTVVADFSWNASLIENSLVDNTYCATLDSAAKAAASDEYDELTEQFAISSCSLSVNISSSLQCNSAIRVFYDECLRDVMGLHEALTSTESSDDRSTSNWVFSSSESITWTGDTASVPVGAVFSTKNRLKVLVHIIEPWGELDEDNEGVTDVEQNMILGYTGFLPTLWNTIIASQGLECNYTSGENMTQDDVITAVSDGDYDVALGAFTITSARTEKIQFLHQFYGGGIRIMTINPDVANANNWFFLLPFTTRLWIIWLGAIIVVAHLIWIMEWDTPTFKRPDENTGRLRRMPYMAAILDALVMSSSVLFFTHEAPRGKHSRWFIAIWEWIVLVLISAYTANMTSFITNSSAADSVITAESHLYLEDTKVITVPGTASADILEAANISYTACDTPDICLEMMYDSINATLNITEDERYNAFVYDDLNIEYWARTSTECAFITGGNAFNSFSAAIPIRYNYVPDDIIDSINLLLITLWSNGTMTQWIESFITSSYPCDPYAGAASETTPLDVPSFWYLWILIGGGSIIFCTVVICTVERSKTPIEEQMAELEYLMKENGGQINRVATLSSTDGGAFETNNEGEKKKKKKKKGKEVGFVDLYSGGDDDGDTNDARTNQDVKELEKAISDSQKKNKQNKDVVEEEEEEADLQELQSSPKQMVKEKTQEKLNALSVFAMDFDPLKGTENKPQRQKKQQEAEVKERKDNENDENDKDKEQEQEQLQTQAQPQEQEEEAQHETAETDAKDVATNDDAAVVMDADDDDDDKKEELQDNETGGAQNNEPAAEASSPADDMVRELSDEEINAAFDGNAGDGDAGGDDIAADAQLDVDVDDAEADDTIAPLNTDELPTAPTAMTNKGASTAL